MSPAALRIASFEALLAESHEKTARLHGADDAAEAASRILPIGVKAVDAALPDGGLPKGAVIELSANLGLGRSTAFALSACKAAQDLAKLRSGNARTIGAWCAFIDPSRTLNAPGVARAGVDLERLLIVRPPLDAVSRVAVRAATSRAFAVIVVDTSEGLDRSESQKGAESRKGGERERRQGAERESRSRRLSLDKWANVVRRLAIGIERSETTVLLLTDKSAPRSTALPVAMRLELDVQLALPPSTPYQASQRWPPMPSRLSGSAPSNSASSNAEPAKPIPTLRVAKERHGRVTGPIAIAS